MVVRIVLLLRGPIFEVLSYIFISYFFTYFFLSLLECILIYKYIISFTKANLAIEEIVLHDGIQKRLYSSEIPLTNEKKYFKLKSNMKDVS